MARHMYVIKDADGHVVSKVNHSKNYGNAVPAGCTKEVIDTEAELNEIEIYVAPTFDQQTCEGDLFTNFLSAISSDDRAILNANQSVAIILRCFSYDNKQSWDTLKAHLASLSSQGVSNKTLAEFKKVMNRNHKDLDA